MTYSDSQMKQMLHNWRPPDAETKGEPPVRSSDLLAECYDYIKTLAECARMETVPDMIANVSHVYLSRKERIALAWRILKTIFR